MVAAGLPLFIAVWLYRHRKKLNKQKTQDNLGFLCVACPHGSAWGPTP